MICQVGASLPAASAHRAGKVVQAGAFECADFDVGKKEVAAPVDLVAFTGALAELSEAHKLIRLECAGVSYRNIAARTGVTIGTVRSRLHFSRRKAKELLACR